MERWKVENFWRTPQANSEPAQIGTTCHFALEHFVKAVYLEKTVVWDNVKYLNDMYQIGYVETFNSTNFDTEAYRDGADLISKWYERNKNGLPNRVISCETKEHFDLVTPVGPIPFNFIWDRCDQIDEEVYEVVDYKSVRGFIRAEDLKEKIQPRAYALAAQIKWPNAKRIWVSFDMLRHDGPVGVVFDRDDNAATWRYLKRAAKRIIDTDEDNTVETLNDGCKWCIKKVSCETLTKAKVAGAVYGLTDDELAQRKMDITNQILALKYADSELDKALCLEAENREEFDWQTRSGLQVNITARPMRKANSNAVAKIVGPELATKYGNFTMTNIDKMLKSGELNPDQRRSVEQQINTTWSEPSAKVKPPKSFEE
jgi:hypothetical protein